MENHAAQILLLNWNGWEDTIIECLECIKNDMYNIKQSKVRKRIFKYEMY